MNNAKASDWDKTFAKSDKVNIEKVKFKNRYGIELVGDLYMPKDKPAEKLPAIAVSGPFGAVKEQASGLYAQTMAGRGFITLAFDPSYTGESGGEPRLVASPDINTEDFSAAVDFLSVQDGVDADKIGIIGICGFGGFALNAAAMDTRIKATVTSTMYDMSRVNANGYFDAMSEDDRYALKQKLNAQRTEDFKSGTYAKEAGLPDKLTGEEPQFVKDYWNYYKTPRGYVKFRKGEFYCTNVCGVLLCDKGNGNTYIAEKLNSVTKRYVSYVGNPKLMNNVMAEIYIDFPSIQEQETISKLLTRIDERIKTANFLYERIISLKQGLLQQLFI